MPGVSTCGRTPRACRWCSLSGDAAQWSGSASAVAAAQIPDQLQPQSPEPLDCSEAPAPRPRLSQAQKVGRSLAAVGRLVVAKLLASVTVIEVIRSLLRRAASAASLASTSARAAVLRATWEGVRHGSNLQPGRFLGPSQRWRACGCPPRLGRGDGSGDAGAAVSRCIEMPSPSCAKPCAACLCPGQGPSDAVRCSAGIRSSSPPSDTDLRR